MSQKVLFYQEDRPKTADGLWMHKDSDGNMKLDYVGNNSVYPLGYINSEAGGGSASDGYKAYIKINPSSAWKNAGSDGLIFTSAAEAAQTLGISEHDFLKFCSAQMPMAVSVAAGVFVGGDAILSAHTENVEVEGEGYIISLSSYEGKTNESSPRSWSLIINAAKKSSEADDSTKRYFVHIEMKRSGELL